MGRVRDDDLVALAALRLVPRPHQQQTGQLAGGAGGRLEGGGGHAGHLAQRLLEFDQESEPALGHRRGSGRVDTGQAGQPRHRVTHLRVVLHGARPERVGAQVDGELPVGEAGEVGHQVAFGHLGHLDGSVPPVGLGHEFVDRHLRDARRPERPGPTPRMGQLEQGRLGGASEQRGRGGLATGGRGRARGRLVGHSGHRLGQGGCIGVDLGGRPPFGDGDQEPVVAVGDGSFQRDARQEARRRPCARSPRRPAGATGRRTRAPPGRRPRG